MSQTIIPKSVTHLIAKGVNKTYVVEENSSLKLDIIDISPNNTKVTMKILIKNYSECNLNIYILDEKYTKNIDIKIIHSSNSVSNTMVKAIASNYGNIKLNLVNIAEKNTVNIEQNQTVDGILFDETSNIDVTPSMLIDTNVIKASHAVNIGNVNPEQLFYLMSRGISKTKAILTILNGMFSGLKTTESNSNLYNKVTKTLKKMI
ncbi:MAG: SufD family Fe-S cluster assembly protein [Mycoplasmataceae bacterium]|jgi:Fe-S cluster assembly protein SufD|nr:SufD family Fe-S cluster assembly protein [Mycoplasmataceae bacterium]